MRRPPFWPFLDTVPSKSTSPPYAGIEQDAALLLDAAATQVDASQVGLADRAVNGPQARAAYGVSGTGIRIGILSDSFNVLGGEAADIAAGLLPAGGVTVLKDGPGGSSDEGRAMAEIIHATAPGAQLYFYTAFNSQQDFANGITALHAAGCQVIVDDTIYPDEPMFQVAGPIDAAVQQAVSTGVDYFTSAGNEGTSFYQAAFAPMNIFLPAFNAVENAQMFSNGTPYQTVEIPGNYQITLSLQWDWPFSTPTSDSITIDAISGNRIVASSTQSAREPAVTMNFPVQPVGTNYSIVILHNPGTPAPTLVKYILEGGGTIADPQAGIGSGSSIGHVLAPGVNAVGAVNIADTPAEGGTPTPEPYSSAGPGEILFAPDGTRLASPYTSAVPSYLAPDGAATSVIDPFFGTSAAAPVAAAVAALMLQARPGLTTGDVTALLADSAIPVGAASVAGAGLIQSDLAVGYASTGLIADSPQPVVHGTSLGGTIEGGAATRQIFAGAGNTVVHSIGIATIVAGAGADTVDLAGASAILYGGSGTLLVRTMNGADTIAGASGSVTVLGGAGGGVEFGGTNGANLLIAGLAPTTLVAGGPNDTLEAAGAGGDLLFATAAGPAVLAPGGSYGGNTYVAIGGGNDVVQTGPGANTTYLGSGADRMTTGGNDIVIAGTGSVVLAVTAGATEFFNGIGTAMMTPGAGADTLVGGTGSATLFGGAGTPLAFGGTAGHNLLLAGAGPSTLIGGGANDTLIGGRGGDVLQASPVGDDTLLAGAGAEIMLGGSGGINVFAAGAANALIAPLASTAVVTMGSGESTLQSGSASEVVQFINGQAGGIDFVEGFNPAADILLLSGYDRAAVVQSIAGQYDTGGDSWLKLSDGTVVAFVGLGHLSANNVAFG